MANGSADAGRAYFPGFVDVAEIGRGRLSTVCRARDQDTGHVVALRLLTTPNPADLAFVERESAALGSVSAHPNIVTLYGLRRAADGRPVLVLELCRGSIAQWLSRDGLPVPDVVTLGVKIASGLDAAHRAGIVHGDLAAHRILVTAQGEPALHGFGLARLRPTARVDVHRAPELLDGRPPTPAGDVFALASVLYELLSGRAPFQDVAGAPARSAGHDQVRPLVGPHVPAGLFQLLVAALARDPAHRPGAGELAGRLTGIQHALATGVWPTDPGAGTDDGWSTPSLVGSHQAPEPPPPSLTDPPTDPTPPTTEPPAAPVTEPAAEARDWSTPSIVGRHAVRDDPPGPPIEPPIEPPVEPPVEPLAEPLAEQLVEPPIEQTRRRPLATMSPAFGELPVSGEPPPAPMPEYPQPAEVLDEPAEPVVQVEPVEPPTIEPSTVEAAPPATAEPSYPVPTPAEHTLPGPIEPRPEPLVAPAAPVAEVAQGEQVREHTEPRPVAPTGQEADVAHIAVAAPTRDPAPDPEALAAALWATPERPPQTPEDPPPAAEPQGERGTAGMARPPGEEWDREALAAAIWAPGQGPAQVGEESGRYPIAAESEVPTATGPVPTWAFGTAARSAPAQSAAPAIGDLTLDPESLRRKVTVRSGGASLTIDETKLVLRHWLRRTELAWPSVQGFEPRFEGGTGPSNGAGVAGAGRLVAITDSGPVELPATRRSMADLRYLHALLDAYRRRALSGRR